MIMAFKEVKAEDLQWNPFTKIGKEWLLITAGTEEKINTMTITAVKSVFFILKSLILINYSEYY